MSETTCGSCLCGSISYQFTGTPRGFQYCHCSRCQKITGSAHGAIMFVKPDQFEWLSGADLVSRFELPEAKFYASCFCSKCGSSLPWEIQGGGNVAIPAGSLDQDPGVRPTRNIFTNSDACWYEPASNLDNFAQGPVRRS
ncbi:GFA family protein [Amphritea balenae]|uniref:GFA family protein n=1 Tax=Amphritea balenae TaxID=452629 RepID=A0A3P1SUG8_9GAMM|nr:GFA family protein [Amphritea balenae]RRD00605.1 GFA family protein [Amphritea balenae]GGK69397.1 aldehyde-activating protein [Amphritea balenae]